MRRLSYHTELAQEALGEDVVAAAPAQVARMDGKEVGKAITALRVLLMLAGLALVLVVLRFSFWQLAAILTPLIVAPYFYAGPRSRTLVFRSGRLDVHDRKGGKTAELLVSHPLSEIEIGRAKGYGNPRFSTGSDAWKVEFWLEPDLIAALEPIGITFPEPRRLVDTE